MEYHKDVPRKRGRIVTTSSPRDVRRRQVVDRDSNRLIDELKSEIRSLKVHTDSGGFTPEKVDAEIRKAVKNAVAETKQHYEGVLKDIEARRKESAEKLQSVEERYNQRFELERKNLLEGYDQKVTELEKRYIHTISQLEDRLKLAEEKVEAKEEVIESLKAEKDQTIKRLLEDHTRKIDELTKSISLKELEVDDPDRPRMEDIFVDPIEAGAGKDLESHVEIGDDISISRKENMAKKVDKLKDLMGRLPKK
jgi:hypothetical protein